MGTFVSALSSRVVVGEIVGLKALGRLVDDEAGDSAKLLKVTDGIAIGLNTIGRRSQIEGACLCRRGPVACSLMPDVHLISRTSWIATFPCGRIDEPSTIEDSDIRSNYTGQCSGDGMYGNQQALSTDVDEIYECEIASKLLKLYISGCAGHEKSSKAKRCSSMERHVRR